MVPGQPPVCLNSKEVRFKIGGGGAPITYKAEQLKEVQTATDTYVYNPDKKMFESAKAIAARGKPRDPGEDPPSSRFQR